MADPPRFYAEVRSEITVMERVKEAADAIARQFEDFEGRTEGISDDETLDLAEAANTATDDGFDWEVIDRTGNPVSRVICRTNRADGMMIVEGLNLAAERPGIVAAHRMINPCS